MYAFSFLIIPCFLVFYCMAFSEFKVRAFIPPVVFGILAGTLICFIKAFFFPANNIWTTSMMESFAFIFKDETIFYSILLFAVYVGACFKIDSYDYKMSMYLPLVLSFYAVFVPFNIFTNRFNTASFILFLKPLLYIFMCWLIQEFINIGYRLFKKGMKVSGILMAIPALIVMVLPAFTEAYWIHHTATVLTYVVTAAMGALSVVLYLLVQRKPLSSSAE